MVKNRYFIYLFLVNALMNIVNFVPRGLINERFDGAAMSIVAAVPIGCLFIFLFVKVMNKFPGQGIPEILHANYPAVISVLLLCFFAILWIGAGLTTLVSFVEVTLRYISIDVEPFMIMLVFLVVVCFCMRINAESILYGVEVILYINFPFILYIFLKIVMDPHLNWDAVIETLTHSLHMPSYKGIATATYVFSGYINLAVFNTVFKNLRVKHLWLLGILGLFVLLATFLIPIGFLGTMAVEKHTYPWFSTADVLRTQNFIIERLLFLFYYNYLTLSLVSTIIHWHVAMVIFKSIMPSKKKKKSNVKMDWWIILFFSAITFVSQDRLGQYSLDRVGLAFLDIRFFAEGLMILTIYIAYRRGRKKKA